MNEEAVHHTDIKKNALDILNALYGEQRITKDEYSTVAMGIQVGPPFGDNNMRYTVFLVDGDFVDADTCLISDIKIEGADCIELGALLRIAMRQDFDMVIRRSK